MHLPWILIFLTIHLLPLSLSDPRISEAGLFYSLERPPANTSATYIPLFVSGMEVLSQHVTSDDWGNYAVNSTNISIYSLVQCHDDLSHDDCLQCYAASRTRLPCCLPASGGRIFLDGCFLRYYSYAFFNESVDPVWDTVNCNSTSPNSTLSQAEFRRNVAESDLSEPAAGGSKSARTLRREWLRWLVNGGVKRRQRAAAVAGAVAAAHGGGPDLPRLKVVQAAAAAAPSSSSLRRHIHRLPPPEIWLVNRQLNPEGV